MMYMLQQPLQFIITLCRTLYQNPGRYLNQLIGSQLGIYTAELPSFVYCSLLAAFFAAIGICASRREQGTQKKSLAPVLIMLSCLSILVIFIFLYVWFTPYKNGYIEGVQGRYFIPLLFPILGAFAGADVQTGEASAFEARLLLFWCCMAACGFGCAFSYFIFA